MFLYGEFPWTPLSNHQQAFSQWMRIWWIQYGIISTPQTIVCHSQTNASAKQCAVPAIPPGLCCLPLGAVCRMSDVPGMAIWRVLTSDVSLLIVPRTTVHMCMTGRHQMTDICWGQGWGLRGSYGHIGIVHAYGHFQWSSTIRRTCRDDWHAPCALSVSFKHLGFPAVRMS